MKQITYKPNSINNCKTYDYLYRLNDTKYTHNYVYLIQHKVTLMMYTGARSCNIYPKDDIGVKYFTSSKYVKSDFKKNPQNYNIWVIQDFKLRSDAIILESALHKQHDVKCNKMFHNRSNQTISGFDTTGNLECVKKMKETKNMIQQNGKTNAQNGAIKAKKTIMKIQDDGSTIAQKVSSKSAKTMGIIQDDGQTIRERSTKKANKTKQKICNNGKTIAQNNGQSTKASRIRNGTYYYGDDAPISKRYTFVDPNGIERFSVFGGFEKSCELMNLPIAEVRKSLKTGEGMYDRKMRMSDITRIKNLGYYTWFKWTIQKIKNKRGLL